jgi:hypothetical protein
VGRRKQDFIPPQHDPEYIVIRTGPAQDKKTNGNGATSYGSDAARRGYLADLKVIMDSVGLRSIRRGPASSRGRRCRAGTGARRKNSVSDERQNFFQKCKRIQMFNWSGQLDSNQPQLTEIIDISSDGRAKAPFGVRASRLSASDISDLAGDAACR